MIQFNSTEQWFHRLAFDDGAILHGDHNGRHVAENAAQYISNDKDKIKCLFLTSSCAHM